MKAVFTDIDGTLLQGHSSPEFVKKLFEAGLFHDTHFKKHEQTIKEYEKGIISYAEWVENYLKVWANGIKNQKAKDVKKIARDYFKKKVKQMIFEDSKKLIQECKNRNYYCVGVSSGLQEIAEQVGGFVGLNTVYGSKAEIIEGIYTGKMISDTHISGGKGRIVDKIVKEQKIDLDKSVGFGDTIHDVEIFKKVAKAMIIDPNTELIEIAELNGWIITEKKDIYKNALKLLEKE